MRLTNILCQLNYHRHFKRVWKRQGKMEVKKYVMSPELQEMGIPIKDAKEILLETKLFKPEPAQKSELLFPIPPSVFNVDVPYYRMHNDVKISENENQALALTKTLAYNGLPTQLSSLIGIEKLPNQDELVQTSILQAVVWDAVQDKLPKLVDPKKPGYRFKRAYGILYSKKVTNLLEKLSFLCDSATGKYDKCFHRHKVLNAYSEIMTSRSGENIIFQLPCEMLMKSKEPLQPFASINEVKATENETVPNIYPIKPTLDLEKCEENPVSHDQIFLPLFGNIHTLFVTQKDHEPWLPAQQLGRAIAACFTFAAVEAQKRFGPDIKELPEPISIQSMYMDAKLVNFLAYQLNTLDLSDDKGIKNQVWIDEASNLYDEVSEVDLIKNYNSSIFPKMLAFHLNGLL